VKILFALPGLHRYSRGAEITFISIARELCKLGESVTLIGSGIPEKQVPYRFLRANSIRRERFEGFPFLPVLRNECSYEELTFVLSLAWRYRPKDYDITVTCSYPFANWVLRRPVLKGSRPLHVFVTQNGDWPPFAKQSGDKSEYRFFGCDGLVCINPDYFERNKEVWNCRLIPNGVDCDRFRPGAGLRAEFGIPEDRFIVLMVSALIPSKRVEVGIEAVSSIPNAHLVIAGDGPLRDRIASVASAALPGRFTRVSLSADRMPILYQSADVFLHCSKDEAFGNVFGEALACGLPIVAHDMPRVRWIVGDEEFLVDTNDPAAIAASLERARRSEHDARLQRVARARRLSWDTIAGEYRQFFIDILSGHTSS
jgi:glycosyltransferase involved in cell wall biosynthesis